MAYRIELGFNEKGEQKIKKYWRILADRDLNSYMIDSLSNPHITLVVYSDILAGRFEDQIKSFSKLIKTFEIRFFGFGIFPTDELVLYLTPKVSKYLLKVHEDVQNEFDDFNDNINGYYLSENWVPHCTLGRNFSWDKIQKAVRKLSKDFKAFKLNVNHISLVEFYPARELYRFNLS